jgi:hypothetical protein
VNSAQNLDLKTAKKKIVATGTLVFDFAPPIGELLQITRADSSLKLPTLQVLTSGR